MIVPKCPRLTESTIRDMDATLDPRRDVPVPHQSRGLSAPTMSTSQQSSAATDVESSGSESPKIEALFLIRFDKKVGCVYLDDTLMATNC
jgi:hypothetical protein